MLKTSGREKKAASGSPAPLIHGARDLPSVVVDSYSLELREGDEFVGDKASRGAFLEKLDALRARVRRPDGDPLGDVDTHDLSKKELDALIKGEDREAAALVHGAVEEFAQELSDVIRRFMRTKAWQGVERIVAGGGFKQSHIGELAIARAGALLAAEGIDAEIRPISHHPDEAGLLGAAHLLPAWMLAGHDALVGVDIGGSNVRAGIVELHLKKKDDLSKAKVWKSELWRHAEDSPSRTATVKKLVEMIETLVGKAEKAGLKVAPVIGVGCPGLIKADGSIARGGQNLPGGNWESESFNLAEALTAAIPTIGKSETVAVLHNDAVLQGLGDLPFMQDVQRWGVVTIGTGLGNASFTNRAPGKD